MYRKSYANMDRRERTVAAGGGGGAGITTPVSSEQSAFCGRSTKHSAQERNTKRAREKESESVTQSRFCRVCALPRQGSNAVAEAAISKQASTRASGRR
eukprot:COSAG06_NODE_1339_length_9813_cov_44.214639_2_plen_99_part_00